MRVAELCTSPNPAVRRTAIELVRAIGGPESLPLLLHLLDDEELQVQRDALRAIVQTGTDEAFAVLRDALTSGSQRTRDMITGSLSTLRDERAAPLLVFIVRQGQIGGRAEKVFLAAVEALGALRVSNDVTVGALVEAAGRGAWWRPFQARRLRVAAVKALRVLGSADAFAALETLARSGRFGAKSAAQATLVTAPRLARPASDGAGDPEAEAVPAADMPDQSASERSES